MSFFYKTGKKRNCSVIINRSDVGGQRGNKISEDGSESAGQVSFRTKILQRADEQACNRFHFFTPGFKNNKLPVVAPSNWVKDGS